MKYVLPHYFDTPEQALQSAKLGTWLFLVTEILLFGGLFVAYIVYRALYPEMFLEASQFLNWKLGGLNTLVLITSSFTMAMAVNTSKKGETNKAFNYLIVTFICACIFMVVKYFEYSHKIHDGLLPAGLFSYEGDLLTHEKSPIFFSIYFMMTGLHGFHVLVGMFLIGWVAWKCKTNQIGKEYSTPVEMTGIYWHLVDLIWIYLFPLLYLT